MTSTQAEDLKQLARLTHSTDADLLWLARLCSGRDADVEIADIHFGEITRAEAEEILRTLRDYERYQRQVEAAEYRLRTCADV